jgi:osmotically-inducible protein OsmY
MAHVEQERDDRIRDDVLERLGRNEVLRNFDIGVVVHDGHVTLEGIVERAEEKELAANAVADVPGVEEVRNRVRVGVPGEDNADDEASWLVEGMF